MRVMDRVRSALCVAIFAAPSLVAADNVTWESTKQTRAAWTLAVPSPPAGAEQKAVALGKRLYHDKLLSADRTISCASCHSPEKGFTDGQTVSAGVGGKTGNRSSPSILNLAQSTVFFWDGRAKSLEEQALGPIANPIEMNLPIPEALARLASVPEYVAAFQECYGAGPSAERVASALAAYERQVYSHKSPFDKWVAGDEAAMSDAAKRGFLLFLDKGACVKCHTGPNFSDGKFHNLGVGMEKPGGDLGRFGVTKKSIDRGAFKTPGLREIAVTAPYLHDGSAKTLDEVVELYDKGGINNGWLDPLMHPLKLSVQEKLELVEFMKALSGTIERP